MSGVNKLDVVSAELDQESYHNALNMILFKQLVYIHVCWFAAATGS